MGKRVLGEKDDKTQGEVPENGSCASQEDLEAGKPVKSKQSKTKNFSIKGDRVAVDVLSAQLRKAAERLGVETLGGMIPTLSNALASYMEKYDAPMDLAAYVESTERAIAVIHDQMIALCDAYEEAEKTFERREASKTEGLVRTCDDLASKAKSAEEAAMKAEGERDELRKELDGIKKELEAAVARAEDAERERDVAMRALDRLTKLAGVEGRS